MSETYLKHVTHSLKDLVGQILIQETLMNRFLKSGRTIGLCDPATSESSFDIQIVPILPYTVAFQNSDSEFLKFAKEGEPGTVHVFRSPALATLTIVIACPRADLATKMNDIDKLNHYFFNHRTIEAFLPESLKQYPQLYQKLIQARAQLKPHLNRDILSSVPGSIFSFEYVAFYHAGTPLRDEKIVQRRTVDISIGTNPHKPEKKEV